MQPKLESGGSPSKTKEVELTKFEEINICLDMFGCPNRCKHCWLGATPCGNMDLAEIERAARAFKPFTDCLEVFDWYREPDYRDGYQTRRELCRQFSDKQTPHYELISVWRAVRDGEYVKWLSALGLMNAQLTIFGNEETTDDYAGRKGVYAETLEAVEILLQNKISPRIQTFVNKNNISELPHVETLIRNLDLENRCRTFGGRFSFFFASGFLRRREREAL